MKRLTKGNEAVVLGALAAGADAFFGYPITPASEIPQMCSEYFPKFGKVFLQAECEIGAINMVYGAAVCGKRAFTSSSGPGISLKQECISFLAGGEVPSVIVDIMRAGPGIGNIGPEQSDYHQVVKGGGHGGYKLIVLAPNGVQEMYDFTIDAFELADQYRTPVFLLGDAMLGQMMEPIHCSPPPSSEHEKPWKLDTSPATNENLITSIYLDFNTMEAHSRHLAEKYDRIAAAEARAQEYRTQDAEIIFSAYGIVSRIVRSAVDRLREQGVRVGMIRPQTLWPFPKDAYAEALRRNPQTKFFVVELSHGQFTEDVRLSAPGAQVRYYSRFGGNLPGEQEILDEFQKLFHGE